MEVTLTTSDNPGPLLSFVASSLNHAIAECILLITKSMTPQDLKSPHPSSDRCVFFVLLYCAGLEDGDLLGDFQGVTAHRAKPTTEYSTASADRTPTLKVFK